MRKKGEKMRYFLAIIFATYFTGCCAQRSPVVILPESIQTYPSQAEITQQVTAEYQALNQQNMQPSHSRDQKLIVEYQKLIAEYQKLIAEYQKLVNKN